MFVPFLLLLSKVAVSAAVADGELSTQHQLCKQKGFMVKTCQQEIAVRHEGHSESVPSGGNDERSRFAAIEDFDELRKVCDELADSYTECRKKDIIEITRAETEVQFGVNRSDGSRFNHFTESDGSSHSSQPDKSDLALVLVTVFLVQLGWIATVMKWKQRFHGRNNIETEQIPSETNTAVGDNGTHSNATTELSQKKNE
jgi:hypothetical protein